MRERIVITGGAGFLGSSLAARLVSRHRVVILDSLARNALARTGLFRHPRLSLIRGDVLDAQTVSTALEGCHRVVHMASVAGVSAVEADPRGTLKTAVAGTANLLEACQKMPHLKRVVVLSSSEVYGPDALNVREDQAGLPTGATGARWSYARGKLAAERLALDSQRRFGVPVTVVRPFNIYGPAQVGEGAVHTFVARALRGLPLEIHNDGRQVRAWCYVDDLVDGLLSVLKDPRAVGRVFNLGNPDQALTVKALAEQVVRVSGSASRIAFRNRSGAEVKVRTPDISHAKQLLDFTPRVELEEGLRRTVDWYRRHG